MCTSAAGANPGTDTLRVINWNLEWFADGQTHNAKAQVAGARKIMTALNADVYALCEIVSPDSLRALVTSLPDSYGYVISTFGSFATDTTDPDWFQAQKLALVYRKSVVRNVQARALMASSATAYYSFSSGRFPYEVRTEVKGRDNQWRPVHFIVLHAKAMTDDLSCNRRIDGCTELKDTLDRYQPTDRFLILGDFNDDLDVSNCKTMTQSNYAGMVNDSAHYKSLTLPISRTGVSSTAGYSSMIDHVISSDEMSIYYVPGSAEVLKTLVKSLVPDYSNDVSDHYPVRTLYVMDDQPSGLQPLQNVHSLVVRPNPATTEVTIQCGKWSQYAFFDLAGRLVNGGIIPGSGSISTTTLAEGLYILLVSDERGNTAHVRLQIVSTVVR